MHTVNWDDLAPRVLTLAAVILAWWNTRQRGRAKHRQLLQRVEEVHALANDRLTQALDEILRLRLQLPVCATCPLRPPRATPETASGAGASDRTPHAR